MLSTSPLSGNRALQPGAIVHVRQRLYLVEQVQSPPNPGDATLVSLSCVDDDAQGQALDVLWEHELDAEIRRLHAELDEVRARAKKKFYKTHAAVAGA